MYLALYLEQTLNYIFCPRYLLSSTRTRSDKMIAARYVESHSYKLRIDNISIIKVGEELSLHSTRILQISLKYCSLSCQLLPRSGKCVGMKSPGQGFKI